MPLVLFHMVVHRVLVLLYLRTDGTDKLAGSILLIDVRHLYWGSGPRRFQFFRGGLALSLCLSLRLSVPFSLRLSPSLLTMTIMTATAVGLFRESFFCCATLAMTIPGALDLFSRKRVNVDGTKLLTTFPAPRAAASSANCKGAACLQSARKDIVTRRIFQSPALAPRTLFCIIAHFCHCST